MKIVWMLVLAGGILIAGVSNAVEDIPAYIGRRGTVKSTGPIVLFGALDPAVRKWYIPPGAIPAVWMARGMGDHQLCPGSVWAVCADRASGELFLRSLWQLRHPGVDVVYLATRTAPSVRKSHLRQGRARRDDHCLGFQGRLFLCADDRR